MTVRCQLLADGRMIVADHTAEPIMYEFLAIPRIGEKIVVVIDQQDKALRVTGVTHHAPRAWGSSQKEAEVLLIAEEE